MALVLVLTAAGLGYLLTRAPDTPHAATAPVIAPATLEIASTPPGAAIFIGGEPTGLVTPATLTGVGPGDLEVRVELPGHQPSARVLDLKSGARVRHTFELTAEEGRLALGGLPPGASILVEQVAHPAGEVITVPAGRHELRVVVAGETIARQTIDIVAGLQAWELRGRDLVPR
ncbi:MAG: PEGA domain-containing protein, partial [Deltaproteobacteria bacterium]|nr:PEGA domain-containing protein [Deltaproteobacteria bacterium]